MQVPLELNIKGVPRKEPLEEIVHEKVKKLEAICDRIISCHVVIEHAADAKKTSTMDHVLIELKLPQHHDLVVKREADDHQSLPTLVRESFQVMRRQLQETVDKLNHKVKTHTTKSVE